MTKKKNIKPKDDINILKSQLVRALADYDNLQKRTEKEMSQFRSFASVSTIGKMLPVLDMFEVAQEHLKDPGLSLALNSFKGVLKEEGVERVESKKGTMFDEEVHEAIEISSQKGKNGEIVEELLPGYTMDKTLIRPAKVKVVRKEK